MLRTIRLVIFATFLVFYIFVPASGVTAIAKEKTGLAKTIEDVKRTIIFIGEIEGNVPCLSSFLKIKDIDEGEATAIFNELKEKGYLNEKGRILNKFKFYKEGFALSLNEKYQKYEKEILAILLQNVRPSFYGTGVLIQVQDIYHLITAKHVVTKMQRELNDENMLIFFNSKEGSITFRSIEDVKNKFGVNWIFHENDKVDIAIIPFGLDPQKDDVLVVPDNLFQTTDRIFETYDIFFLSYQPGIEQKKVSPIIRNGTISLINDDKTFFIDAFAFPGNSGSPVFLKPSPIRFDEDSISIGGDNLGGKFVGIIGAYLPYEEMAISTQTGRPRIVFEENTGLAKVWSVEFIKEITDSDMFKKQVSKIKNKTSGKTKP